MVVSSLSPVVSGLSAVHEHQENALPAAPNEHADATGAQGFPSVLMRRRRMILSVLSSKKQKKEHLCEEVFLFHRFACPRPPQESETKGLLCKNQI